MTKVSNLEKLREKGIKIDWATVLVGWDRFLADVPQLTTSEVIQYATNFLASSPENDSQALLTIVISTEEDEALIRKALHQLVQEDHSSEKVAQRKWRVLVLSELRENIESLGATHGLIKLTEFWDRYGFPKDMPHVVQGRENAISPQQYYTIENFKKTLERHDVWIQTEVACLAKIN